MSEVVVPTGTSSDGYSTDNNEPFDIKTFALLDDEERKSILQSGLTNLGDIGREKEERKAERGSKLYIQELYEEIYNNIYDDEPYVQILYSCTTHHILISENPFLQTKAVCITLKDYERFLRGFTNIIKGEKEIEAIILYFLQKYKVIYISLAKKIIPDSSLKTSKIQHTFNSLKDRGIIFYIGEGWQNDKFYLRERKTVINRTFRYIDKTYQKPHEVKWFGITQKAIELLPSFTKQIIEIISEDAKEKIEDTTFKKIFAPTHKALAIEAELKIRKINDKIHEIEREIEYIRERYDLYGLDFYNELNQRWQAIGSTKTREDRLRIAEQLLRETKAEVPQ